MKKQLQLSVQESCHENWEAMTTSEKGRYCGHCQKQVIDFTGMSDRQLAEFFKKPSTGSVCGRFMTDQLERDIVIPRKRIPWIRYFFQFALPAFLVSLKTSAAKAQGRATFTTDNKAGNPASPKLKNDTLVMPEVVITAMHKTEPEVLSGQPGSCMPVDLAKALAGKMGCGIVPYKPAPVNISDVRNLSISALGIQTVRRKDTIFTVMGVVKNMQGEPLAGASVMISNGHTGTATNNNGAFSIAIKPGDKLLISYIGYERRLITDPQPGNANTVILMDQRLEAVTLGMVVTVKKKKKKSTPPIIAEPGIHSGASGIIKTYPNPLTPGQPLTVECKKIEQGPCSIQLLALSGQTVYQQEKLPEGKKNQVTLNLPLLRPGEYILVVTHQQTGKKYTGKIIIQ